MHVNSAHLSEADGDRKRVQGRNTFSRAKLVYACIGVFVVFFLLFALLRTKNILAVDGGIRCLEVYRRQSMYFDINNHLLQPAHVWAWTQIAGMLGYNADSTFRFYSLVQLMNCFAGAACLAIVFFLMYSAVSSWTLALAGTIAYGFTKAFLEQVTNANEAPMGLFWSLLALLFAALCFRVKSNWPVVVSAMLFALSMATYQTMILLFPAAVILIWTSRSAKAGDSGEDEKRGEAVFASQLRAFAAFALVGVATSVCIFGYAYWIRRIRSPSAILKTFFRDEGAKTYLGVNGGKILNLPVGLTRNILPLARDYSGIRNLLAGPPSRVALFLLTLVFLALFLAACLGRLWNRRLTMTPCARSASIAATFGLLFTAVPLAIWDPNYDKFWLQPLACLAFLIVLALYVMRGESDFIALASRTLGAILLAGVLSNSVWAVQDHLRENLDLRQAQHVAEIVGKRSLVVGSWDGPSLLYGSFWATEGGYLDFTTDASFHGRRASDDLRAAVSEAQARSDDIYFIGLLDLTPHQWDDFLGRRCGIPYSDLDTYRTHSSVITKIPRGTGEISLFRLNAHSTP